MTEAEKIGCVALSGVRFPVASPPKRFARWAVSEALGAEPKITDKQAVVLWRTVWRFRRQIRDQAVVAEAKRNGAHEQLRMEPA